MTTGEIAFAIIAGLAINEVSELSPWLARRLVRWSAYRRYADGTRAEIRAEELAALINDRPGKLFKLMTALGFAAVGIAATVDRRGGRLAVWVSGRETLVAAVTGPPVLVGVWSLLAINDVGLPEAYTLPLAAVATLIGVTALRRRPYLPSWTVYGPALLVAFAPSVVLVLVTDTGAARTVLLAVAAGLILIVGAVRRLKAPVTVGALVGAGIVLYALALIGLWLVLAVVGASLMLLGAQVERRRRAQGRLPEVLDRSR